MLLENWQASRPTLLTVVTIFVTTVILFVR